MKGRMEVLYPASTLQYRSFAKNTLPTQERWRQRDRDREREREREGTSNQSSGFVTRGERKLGIRQEGEWDRVPAYVQLSH